MRKLTKELLTRHDSYIEALKDAIQTWESTDSMEEKRKYMIVIGEIGSEIRKMNKTLHL